MKPNSPIFKNAEGEARYMAAYDVTLAEWPKPYDTLEVSTRFGCTHIHAAGPKDAPPLFLLHGYTFSSTMWAPNMAALSQQHRVYAPDTLGDMGRSVPTAAPVSGAEYAQSVSDLLDELGIDQADIAGLSYGGWIALNLAITAPQRVRRLILMDPAASLLPLVPQFFFRAFLSILLPGNTFSYNFVRWMSSRRSKAGNNDFSQDPLIRQFAIGMKVWQQGRGASPTVFSDDELRSITTPTLLMMGEDEVIYNPDRAIERARRLIPNLQVEVIPDAGHAISIEQPEIVNEHILRFLA
jgi:pimeloyl-ACP methyl ester carboxylesterase